jgi:hypothetical protein
MYIYIYICVCVCVCVCVYKLGHQSPLNFAHTLQRQPGTKNSAIASSLCLGGRKLPVCRIGCTENSQFEELGELN